MNSYAVTSTVDQSPENIKQFQTIQQTIVIMTDTQIVQKGHQEIFNTKAFKMSLICSRRVKQSAAFSPLFNFLLPTNPNPTTISDSSKRALIRNRFTQNR
jgi:hypothetical protein